MPIGIEITLTLDSVGADHGNISVDFDIMEQDDGCVIQLLYAGLPNVPIELTGAVVGQRGPTQLRFPGSISTPADQYEKLTRNNGRLGIVATSVGLVFAVLIPLLIKLTGRKLIWIDIIMLPMPYLLIALGVYAFYSPGAPEPPFGFR